MILSTVFAALAGLVIYVLLKGGLDQIARGRKYKSGTGWCVWRWTDVDSEYILRLHVIKTPWCAVCLHWIHKPDAEPWLHDHPVSFLSIILRGWYTELRQTPGKPPHHKINRRFNFIRASATDKHRIILTPHNTLTLCFMGPKRREWGFHVWEELEPRGWIMWRDYYARLKAGENMRQNGAGIAMMHLAAREGDSMADRFNRTYTGTCRDEDGALIDTAPADAFNSDEITGEFKR